MEDVTYEDLKQYQRLKRQIEVIRAELEAVYVASPAPKENIAGKSSVRPASDPTANKARKAIRIREKLERQEMELLEKQDQILTYTLQIQDTDPEIAAIIRMHFIHGTTWEKTCIALYGYPDDQYCRHKVRNWFLGQEGGETNQ